MTKRTVIGEGDNITILDFLQGAHGEIAVTITAVDKFRGKNVSVVLGSKELQTLQRKIRDLQREHRSRVQREAVKNRRAQIGEE